MKHLLIVEPTASGHRMHYVRHVLAAAVERGIRVTIATWPESLEHLSFRLIADSFAGRYQVLLLSRKHLPDALLRQSTGFRQQHGFHRMMADLHAAIPAADRPDHVLVPFLNMIDKVVPLLGSPFGTIPWSGIVMRDTFHHEAMGIPGRRRRSDRLKQWLFLALLRSRRLQRLFTIDAALPEWLAERYPRLAPRLTWLPDPVRMQGDAERSAVREALGIAASASVLLVYGVIDGRKRLPAALAALADPACPADVTLLVAGPQGEEANALFASGVGRDLLNAGRVVRRNAYLTDREEFEVFRAADFVWVGYRDHYTMSAVLIQAAAMGLPVIACSEGLIGWITRREGLGAAVEVDDASLVAAAIRHLSEQPDAVARHAANGRQLAERHLPGYFADRLLDGIFPELVTAAAIH